MSSSTMLASWPVINAINCTLIPHAVPFAKTKDGFESQFQVNHLGHFLLTHLLLDDLKASAPSRIVNLSSKAHLRWQKPIDYVEMEEHPEKGYVPFEAYGKSKLSNILFTYQLHKYLNGQHSSGVTVNCLHPGLVDTQLLVKAGFGGSSAIPVGEGSKTSIYLASSPGRSDQFAFSPVLKRLNR
jgi:NAD(P)-dependent dehydrogenase (short-subunit alcohol dehydrogenase family)